MPPSFVPLQSFIETIKNLGFFQRLFSWQKVRTRLIDAAGALSSLQTEVQNLEGLKTALANEVSGCRKDIKLLEEQKTRLEAMLSGLHEAAAEKDHRIAGLSGELASAAASHRSAEILSHSLKTELAEVRESLRQVQQNLREAREECIQLRKDEEGRKAEQARAMETLQKWREQVQADRNREIEERQQAEIERLKALKQTWTDHENMVKNRMRSLCQKHTIEYAETVPFKGTPDNAIRLCHEYIVFDAKSPGSDDLHNFPLYLKDQAEKAKKYARQEAVKKDVFFVVPSNTLEVIRQTVFPHGDFDVYIVSVDVLEPLLLCLQKIETYEFAEQLTPEERENICRIIGRFTHLTKRRIQIDSFFARQFMELVLKCDSDLPQEIKTEVAQFEKAEKLNPPSDRRSKTIDPKQLQKDMLQLEIEIESRGIAAEDFSEGLNGVRLYKDNSFGISGSGG